MHDDKELVEFATKGSKRVHAEKDCGHESSNSCELQVRFLSLSFIGGCLHTCAVDVHARLLSLQQAMKLLHASVVPAWSDIERHCVYNAQDEKNVSQPAMQHIQSLVADSSE